MQERGLAWNSRQKRGIVITCDDTAATGTIEYVVLAHTSKPTPSNTN
jgi:hypothetical protein